MTYEELIEIIEKKCEEGISNAFNYGNGGSHAIQEVAHVIWDAVEEYPELLTQEEGDELAAAILERHGII